VQAGEQGVRDQPLNRVSGYDWGAIPLILILTRWLGDRDTGRRRNLGRSCAWRGRRANLGDFSGDDDWTN